MSLAIGSEGVIAGFRDCMAVLASFTGCVRVHSIGYRLSGWALDWSRVCGKNLAGLRDFEGD